MKLFGIGRNRKAKTEPSLSSDERLWIESNFEWLLKTFGRPSLNQLPFDATQFPNTFSHKEVNIDALISDFCTHLGLNKYLFRHTIVQDIRTSTSIPHSVYPSQGDCFLETNNESWGYNLIVAKHLLHHPQWLSSLIALEVTKAKLIHAQTQFDTDEDTDLFLYLAATFFGFGIILAQNLSDSGRSSDGFWETSWSYHAAITEPGMAYILACQASIMGLNKPDWPALVPKEIRAMFEHFVQLMQDDDLGIISNVISSIKLDVAQLIEAAEKAYQLGNYSEALEAWEKLLSLVEDTQHQAEIHNNIGYAKLRLEKFKDSIHDFRKALVLSPQFGFANDNLGLALILQGDLKAGLNYLENAFRCDDNDIAYSYRNKALYFQKKSDMINAAIYFQKSYNEAIHVELLDYYYGLFILESGGNKTEALSYIQKSAALGEREGINYLTMHKYQS